MLYKTEPCYIKTEQIHFTHKWGINLVISRIRFVETPPKSLLRGCNTKHTLV